MIKHVLPNMDLEKLIKYMKSASRFYANITLIVDIISSQVNRWL